MAHTSKDIIKVEALGRNFTIGSLYDYVEDKLLPSPKLWDPSEVSQVADTKVKMTKSVCMVKWTKSDAHENHSSGDEDSDDEENENAKSNDEFRSVNDLGLDDHSATSMAAGLLDKSVKGSWRYAVDRSHWLSQSFGCDSDEVVVHCRCVSKKVMLDPTKEPLEIVCRPEKVINSTATHVVVGVSYGLEAFSVFTHDQLAIGTSATPSAGNGAVRNDQGTISELNKKRMKDCARMFANCLLDGAKRLELDLDELGIEEDGGLHLVPNDFRCKLYIDCCLSSKDNSMSTSNELLPVAQHYETCLKVLEHRAKDAIPLSVWLFPLHEMVFGPELLHKMSLPEARVSLQLHQRFQNFWAKWRKVRILLNSFQSTIAKKSNNNNCNWAPRSATKRIQYLEQSMVQFSTAMLKMMSDWATLARRGEFPDTLEANNLKSLTNIETISPFAPKSICSWMNHQIKQMETLKLLADLPGAQLVTEVAKLNKEMKKIGDGWFATVLHLPSMAGNSMDLIQKMTGWFNSQMHISKRNRRRRIGEKNTTSINCRSLYEASEEFSNWVTQHNRDTPNVRFFILYSEHCVAGTAKNFTSTSAVSESVVRLYDCKTRDMIINHFAYPEAPNQVTVEDNYRGVVELSWTVPSDAIALSGYVVQYRNVSRSENDWNTIMNPPTMYVVISHLNPGETYVFRVAVATLGGWSPFSPVSDEVTIDAICLPPEGLRCLYVTDDSVAISWEAKNDHYNDARDADKYENEDNDECDYYCDCYDDGEYEEQGDECDIIYVTYTTSSYAVECWQDGDQDSTIVQRSTEDNEIVIEPFMRDTVYCIQVRTVCKDDRGNIFYSSPSAVMKIKTKAEPEKLSEIIRQMSQECASSGSSPRATPGTHDDIRFYKIPLRRKIGEGTTTTGVSRYVFGEPTFLALEGPRRQRTILLLGATGSGKTTLINAMANYILGIEWDDPVRFKLIDEPSGRSQAQSQTELITTYDLYERKGSRMGYSLTVVDTPGFGDTRGFEKDQAIMQQLRDYFTRSSEQQGLRQLDAVCLVVQSSLPRLTATQQYIFDSILSIFGSDIKDNIRLMVTFADNELPPALDAVIAAGIPTSRDAVTGQPLHHKFNNSIFFEAKANSRHIDEIRRIYFDMAVEGFDKFFKDLSSTQPKSLSMTREVIDQRKKLEALVEGMHLMTQKKLVLVEEHRQVEKKLADNRLQMQANREFEFEVNFLVPKSVDISGTGQFTTNCQKCTRTCHFPCRQASDENKHLCSVMNPVTHICLVCSCPSRDHYNQKYRYEMVVEKVKRSSESIRKEYQGASNQALTNQQLLVSMQKELKQQENRISELKRQTEVLVRRLDAIALKPHPLSKTDYIDLAIEAEKNERHRPGFEMRLATLGQRRQASELMCEIVREFSTSLHKPPNTSDNIPKRVDCEIPEQRKSNNLEQFNREIPEQTNNDKKQHSFFSAISRWFTSK